MSPLDLLILAAVISAVIGGYRLGFMARITSWAGLGLGIFLGIHFLPDVAGYFADAEPGVRALAAIAFLLAAGMLGQGVGLAIGAALHASLRIGPGLRQYDRVAGAVTGAVGIFIIFWLLAPSLAQVPGAASRWTRDSAVLRVATDIARPPNIDLAKIIGSDFPRVFEGLKPNQDVGPPPANSSIPADVRARVIASTVKVEGQACRKVQEGSGFAVASDLVVTNAHVVAGESATSVIMPSGKQLTARVVAFDPNRDVAVLRVAGLGDDPLSLGSAQEGDVGSVFGHPGGGQLVESPAKISQEVTAVGRDIYDRQQTRRDVFILAANLHPGDSGGAFVDPQGEVVGVAFAIAPDRPGTAYALTDEEIRPVIASAGSSPVDTGPCLS